MRRLTKNYEDYVKQFPFYSQNKEGYSIESDIIYEKLGFYEDLEKKCMKENYFSLMMLLKKWEEFSEDISELYKYRSLEKQRKLLKLPIAVGSTVYEVQEMRERIQPYTITSIVISNCANQYRWKLKDSKGIYSNLNGFSEYDIGKTVFLTEEEANAVLKKKTEENKD